MKGVADGNGTFLASTAENWTHLTTSHGTQGGRGEFHVAEGIVGISMEICRYVEIGIWPLFIEEVMSSALNLWPHLVSHLMFFPLALPSGSC